MDKELLTLLRKGKGEAIQILFEEDEKSTFKVIKYTLTHNMSNYNTLGKYLFSYISNNEYMDEYIEIIIKHLLSNKKIMPLDFITLLTILYGFSQHFKDVKEFIEDYPSVYLQRKRRFNHYDYIKFNYLLKDVYEINKQKFYKTMELIKCHSALGKKFNIFRVYFINELYEEDEEFNIYLNNNFALQIKAKEDFEREQEENVHEISYYLKRLKKYDLFEININKLPLEKKHEFFNMVINSDDINVFRNGLFSYQTEAKFSDEEIIKLVNLFYMHQDEDNEYINVLYSALKDLKHSYIRELAKYLIDNNKHILIGIILFINNINKEDIPLLNELIKNNLDYSDEIFEVVDIEDSFINLFYDAPLEISKETTKLSLNLVRYIYDNTYCCRVRYKAMLILDAHEMLNENDIFVLDYDAYLDTVEYINENYPTEEEDI